MHPIFNLHSMFACPYNNKESDLILLVNSWLGPNEYIFYKSEIQNFIPENNFIHHWTARIPIQLSKVQK